MKKSNITYTQEDYLRSIYLLQQETNNPVKLVDLVKNLNLSKSTVTQRLQGLEKNGWVKHESYGPVSLTQKGLEKAENLTYKHRIIEIFLHDILKIPENEIHEEAHKMEHTLSDKVIKKIADLIGNPTKCPHGKKIPKLK